MNPKKRIGELLLEAGIIDETQLKAALGHQRQWGVRLGQALVDLKLASEADIVGALAVKYGFGVAELGALEPYALEQALKLLPREFAVRNNVFPMAADTASVTVAMSDPTNLAVVDEIRFRTGRKVRVCIGGDHEVADALKRHYPGEAEVEAIALDLDADDAQGEAVFDPFGGGSKDALEAFFSPAGEAAEPAAAEPPAQEPPPARAAAPAQAGKAPAPAAARQAPVHAGTPTSPGLRAVAAAPPPASGPAPAAAHPRPAPAARAPAAPAPRSAAAPPASARAAPAARPAAPAPPSRVELELEERAPEAPQEGTADFTLTDEVTGSGLLIPAPEEEGPPAAGPTPEAGLTPREAEILRALERLAGGAHAEPEILRPAQAMAALALLLVRKGILTEQELLAAISGE